MCTIWFIKRVTQCRKLRLQVLKRFVQILSLALFDLGDFSLQIFDKFRGSCVNFAFKLAKEFLHPLKILQVSAFKLAMPTEDLIF